MVKVNVLSDCLRTIVNAERKGKKQVLIRPVSKLVIQFLRLMQAHGYIGEMEIIDDHRSKKIVVELIGRVNKCGVISPRYDVTLPDFEKWTNSILPSRQFGHLVISTNQGIFTHEEARHRHIGGKILGFFYWFPIDGFYWWFTLNMRIQKNHPTSQALEALVPEFSSRHCAMLRRSPGFFLININLSFHLHKYFQYLWVIH